MTPHSSSCFSPYLCGSLLFCFLGVLGGSVLRHSALTPASRMIFPYLSSSLRKYAARSSGVPLSGFAPWLDRLHDPR